MFLGMGGAGGVSKNVDNVAAKIAQIEASLKSIDKLMGNIGKSSGSLAGALPGGGGTGSGLGAGAALFSGRQAISTAPSFSEQFSGRFPKTSSALGMVAGVGSGVWNALPTAGDVVGQRQALFSASLGMSSPDYNRMNANLRSAFGGYATSTSSMQEAAAVAARFGYVGSNGLSAGGRLLAGQASALSLINGQSQAQNMASGMALAAPQTANRLMQMGIASVNKNGDPSTIDSTVTQLWNRMAKVPLTAANVNRALKPGSNLNAMLSYYYGENADNAANILRMKAGSPGSNANTPGGLSSMAKNGFYNPNAAVQEATGTRAETVAAYGDKVIAGFNAALTAAQKLDQTLTKMESVLGPLAYGKAFNQTFSGTASGAAAVGAAGLVGSGAGNLLSNMAMGRGPGLGAKIMSSGRGPGATGWGTALGRAGGLAGAAAAAAAAQGALISWGDEHGMGADTGVGQFGRVAASAGTGALAGAAIGSIVPGIGTAIGGVIGGLIGGGVGLFTNLGDSGSTMGSPGGGGPSGSAKTGKGGRNVNRGGASGAVAWAIGQVSNPDKDYSNLCDHFVGRAYGRAHSGYRTAYEHWQSIPAKLKHKDGNPPPGALVFWFTGKGRAGHVALSIGGGKVASNDILRRGKIDIVSIGTITRKWNATYLGWAPPYFGGKSVANLGAAGAAAASSTTPTAGASTTAATSNYASTGVSAGSPQGSALVTASAYGGVSASEYSISGMVSTSLAGMMSLGSAPSQGQTQQANSRSQDPSTAGATATPTNMLVSSAPTKGGFTKDSWAAAFLSRLGIKQTSANVKAVSTWERYEGGHWNNRARYNPLNTTQIMDGNDPSINSHGVKAYSNWNEGLDASVRTIRNGRYGAILKALAGGSEKDIYGAITSSPWGTKNLPHYSAGAWRIGSDQIAKIHQGEMILPASIAEAVRTGMRQNLAGQKGGGASKSVVIQVMLNGASEADARKLANRVKQILAEDDEIKTIGGH